ncbi:FAD-dependent monooxygenase [Paenibacillus illinoisensis]|uniref:FAD-dependent monooxygenase n=1 Tax=Paenibacillus illinoisensis TaxID=59845 RepID=A0ABW8HXZ6_9BACL
MDLQSGKLYWPTTIANPPFYPKLEEDISCDVLIIGAGSSGAQCANFFCDQGVSVVIVDKRKVVWQAPMPSLRRRLTIFPAGTSAH